VYSGCGPVCPGVFAARPGWPGACRLCHHGPGDRDEPDVVVRSPSEHGRGGPWCAVVLRSGITRCRRGAPGWVNRHGIAFEGIQQRRLVGCVGAGGCGNVVACWQVSGHTLAPVRPKGFSGIGWGTSVCGGSPPHLLGRVTGRLHVDDIGAADRQPRGRRRSQPIPWW